MKLGKVKNLFFGLCGVVAGAAIFSSCSLEPYEISQEELYLRSFIRTYGLIDPNQDFNEAMESEITVVLGSISQDVNVFIKNLDRYYRVAFYAKATGEVTIPIDVPQTSTEVYVWVGDDIYRAPLGSTVDITKPKTKTVSRADEPEMVDPAQIESVKDVIKSAQELAWVLAAEDLGATDDFDFNDMIIRIESVALNDEAVESLKLQVDVSEWEIIEWDEHLNLEDYSNPKASAPAGNRSRAVDAKQYVKIRVTALAAGGTLPLYLHFQSDASDESTDYMVTFDYGLVGINEGSANDNYEWHRWFDVTNVNQMINTGWEGSMRPGKSATFILEGGFSMAKFSQVFTNQLGVQGSNNGDHYDVPVPPETNITSDYYTNMNRPIQGFFITVNDKNKIESQAVLAGARPGVAPQIFLIPDLSNAADGLWHWPRERVSIIDCYQGFREWINTGSGWWYNRLITPPAGSDPNVMGRFNP